MSTIKGACPKCHRELDIEIDDSAAEATVPQLYVSCDHCGAEKKVTAFRKEYRWQQDAPERERVAREAAARKQAQREAKAVQREERKRQTVAALEEAERAAKRQPERDRAAPAPGQGQPESHGQSNTRTGAIKYHITGVERTSGKPIEITLEAPTPSAAEEQANRLGVVVERLDLDQSAIIPAPAAPLVPSTPSGQPVIMRPAKQVQTIEKTGKQWKGAQLVGGLLLVAALAAAWFVGGVLAWSMFILGVIVLVVAHVGAWWYHG